jgi:hypothetical protein
MICAAMCLLERDTDRRGRLDVVRMCERTDSARRARRFCLMNVLLMGRYRIEGVGWIAWRREE